MTVGRSHSGTNDKMCWITSTPKLRAGDCYQDRLTCRERVTYNDLPVNDLLTARILHHDIVLPMSHHAESEIF